MLFIMFYFIVAFITAMIYWRIDKSITLILCYLSCFTLSHLLAKIISNSLKGFNYTWSEISIMIYNGKKLYIQLTLIYYVLIYLSHGGL